MRHVGVIVGFAALAILGAGCSSTPPAHFYTLSPTSTPAATSSELSVAVGPVAVPAAVDRPQIVVSLGPNSVWLDEFNRWAAPLQDDIARVVAENLVAMLGTPSVARASQTVSEGFNYRAVIAVEKSYEALAAAHSRAVARLSRDIADAVGALERQGK